ncbi:hypothetical protein [Ramlibacter sp. WS9]|uniref:hypothetical protein n=1 Tax=Ramlibacter sp. WS9 TaxID=1882741 RepID=UPI0011426B30|nr:hypothetical protein [Ramlibacter sp. WS9]ROZ69351.1 hypothetical protein EEB15_22785 [Ramlibacter sp. WS9]
MRKIKLIAASAAAAALLAACATTPATGPMSFFVTSAGSGKGADLGGIAGADAICQRLGAAAGAGGKAWRAYLSTPPVLPSATSPGAAAVHARDRIGAGPWFNAKGVLVASNVANLHSGSGITKEVALDERGNVVKGRGDTPNEHDMLTGSREDGTAFAPQTDTTCKGWTSSTDGSAVVGHHDRTGPNADNWSKSWNFSHQSAGCSQEALVRTGGAGRFYCFASN